jgi:hypothetical protein
VSKLKTSPHRAVAVPSTAITSWLRERAISSGADPSVIPDQAFRMLRPREAWEMIGIGKTSFYELVKQGAFQLVPVDGQASRARAA